MLVVACTDVAARADAIRAALAAGVDTIQLREPGGGGRAAYDAAVVLRGWTRATGARLLVNDRLDVACAAGADGVHLPAASWPITDARRLLAARSGQRAAEARDPHDEAPAPAVASPAAGAAGRTLWIGRSTHAPDEAAGAERDGADYVVLGPIYDTPSKRAYGAPLGLSALRRCPAHFPVVAIGGVTAARVPELLAAGAAGVAVVREILGAGDPEAAARALIVAMDVSRGRRSYR
jgi:thiamine-phosphate pyrophosphorylase